jgi:hypothetical protein
LSAQDTSKHARTNPPAAPGGAAARTAQQEVESLLDAAKRRDAVAFWDWLPAGYQDDLEGLAHELAHRVDAKTYDRTWQMLRRTAKVAIDKQRFVFANPTVSAMLQQDPQQAKNAQAAYRAVFELIHEVAKSDLSTIEGLHRFDGRKFLAKSGKPVLETMFTLAKLQGEDPAATLERTTVRTVKQSGTETRIEMRAPGKAPEVETFVLSGGRWLPQNMVRNWPTEMARLRARLAEMPEAGDRQTAAQTNLVLGMVETYVRRFEEVDTQQEFDDLCAELMALANGRSGQTQQPKKLQPRR